MKAPFPWFGGKRRVAHIVWERFGDPINYVEPFFGSGAVLLARPHAPRCETINDKDCMIANFWRAIATDPEETAFWADHPVNEADLHARHTWLVKQIPWHREMLMVDPHYFDAKIAGWWVWGLSQWIGGEWCKIRDNQWRRKPRLKRGGNFSSWRKRPIMKRGGVGVHRTRPSVERRRPHLSSQNPVQGRRRPVLSSEHRGLEGLKATHRQVPDLHGEGGAYNRGIHASAFEDKNGTLTNYFFQLSERMRRARVCCGNWDRILGYSPTTAIGQTAVFLDPPYAHNVGRVHAWVKHLRGDGPAPDEGKGDSRDTGLYNTDDQEDVDRLVAEVSIWAADHGNDPLMRIALCGYDGEHEMPEGWECVAWQPNGGYANAFDGKGKKNKGKERIWFSPHCLSPKQSDLLKV